MSSSRRTTSCCCRSGQVAPFDVGLPYPASVDGTGVETYLDWMRSAYLITMTGCPVLGDAAVLRAGYAFEQATRVGERRPEVVAAGTAEGGRP